jgi:aldehyde:ferredoxin oxidoreductase
MEFLSSDKILVVDLTTSETSEDELSEDLVAEKIGGAGITKYLYEQHEADDPVVLGCGLLTGTLFPAAGAGVITAKSPVTGKVCHVPMTLKNALEMQYAGFDYIVIKGKSDHPVFLWIHDGVADINDASDVWGKDVWETTDAWRKALGEDLIQTLVIGKAGEEGSDYAQICQNYWNSGDRFGFGKLFGQKQIKGVAFRGMGLLEIADPEEYIDRCLEILESVKKGAYFGKEGIADIAEALGEGEAKKAIESRIHRNSACYNTPYPTNTFFYIDEDPKMLEETDKEEPGVLVSDVYALIGFVKGGLPAEDIPKAFRNCARYGIDPLAMAELSNATNIHDIDAAFSGLSGTMNLPGKGVFSPWTPVQPVFGKFDDAGEVSAWWERRQAVAYIFGIHPVFAVMSPELTEEDLLDLAIVGTDLEFDLDLLDEVVAYLTK